MLKALARAGLLTVDVTEPADPVARMNRYVQESVLTVAKPDLVQQAARAAGDALVQIWPGKQPHSWLAAALRSSAENLRRAAGDALWVTGCHRLLPAAGRSLEDARMTDLAVSWWRAVAGEASRLSPDHPDTLAARTCLAMAFTAAQDMSAAIQQFQLACAGYERVLGADHPGALMARADLARAHSAAGQLGDAVMVMRDAIGRSERALSPGDPVTIALRQALEHICEETL
jgi:tetratricopeptide repeat protein